MTKTSDAAITDSLTLKRLRGAMAEHFVSVNQLAEAAGIHPSNVTHLLRGSDYLGAARRQRLAKAARLLGLDQPE